MKKPSFILLVLALSTATAFAGAGREQRPTGGGQTSGQKNLRVVWWGGDLRHQLTLEVIALFEKANPDIKVIPEYSGFDSYIEKQTVQVAGGNAPDVMQFGGYYPDYVRKDALLELDKYRGNLFDDSRFDQDVLVSGSYQGHLYAICLGTNSRILAYNKSLLERAKLLVPQKLMTWEELERYGLSIASNLPPGVYPLQDYGSDVLSLSYYTRQYGHPLYREEGTQAKEEDLRGWLSMWQSFRDKKIVPDIETTTSYTDDISSSALVMGKVVLGHFASNQLIAYQNAMSDELEIIPLPDQEKRGGWLQPSQYLAIYKKTSLPDEAIKFINFFVNDPEAGKVLGNERGISSSQIVREAIAPLATPMDKKVYELYSIITKYTSPADPEIPNGNEFGNIFRLIYQQIAYKQISMTEGVKNLYGEIQRVLSK
jgi:multiple sugar transport system substrate-binding protein